MTPAPPSASLRRRVYPILIRLTNLQQIRPESPFGPIVPAGFCLEIG